ncbi:nitrite reductase small subunit NirD [Vibrio sp. SS-MA-C1-2]|uniref:nitrite reductase small subunit NirD n=1 Tax=Vibrio sp. SS-MA-C1-2 TaxID=2908646 RepID=UPI001F208DED|nr:nitrite reductase small subunit NirD [Vibrio sp. SS-MA-C1-2]UJF17177.1 nitrite reductase small subunit NirD [Vibrio sp. SS-MA-C1-2]
MSAWTKVCQLDDIIPGLAVCALIEGKQVAIFRPNSDDALFAIDNCDPFSGANVLSRGLICEHKDDLWVASPLKKQRFRLTDGLCYEDQNKSVASYPIRVVDNNVEVSIA